MRKPWTLAIFLLSFVSLVSVSSFAQDEAPTNPPRQGDSAPRQMRGPAPPVPGPPHDPHDLTGVWNGRRGYGGSTFSRQGPEMTEWGQREFKKAKASNGGQYTLKETNDPRQVLTSGDASHLSPAGSDASDTDSQSGPIALRV